MEKHSQTGVFYKFTCHVAWILFWTIIGAVCVALKVYFLLLRRTSATKNDSSAGPIRIGFCENGAGYGGAIISLAAFLEKLPQPYEAVIYTSNDTEQYRKLSSLGVWRHVPSVRVIAKETLDSRGIPFASAIDNLVNLLPSAIRYYFAFRRDKIKCVYLNNDASCNFAAAIAARFSRIPLVLHARGFNTETKGNCWVLSSVDHCIAVSSAVRDNLIELGVPVEKCTIVPEGLDLNVFHPKPSLPALRNELGLEADQTVITLVGGLVDWKGQDVLLEAAPMIFEQHSSAIILLVGGAYGRDNAYAEEIARRATAKELVSRVRLLGMREDVADILSCSDIVVHASTKPEPFGRTFLEGMALGKAVIASNEGGPVDVITNHFDGLLVEPRDAVILAEAINNLLKNPSLRASLGEQAALRATAYSIESHTDAISLVLRHILKREFNGHGVFDGIATKLKVLDENTKEEHAEQLLQ